MLKGVHSFGKSFSALRRHNHSLRVSVPAAAYSTGSGTSPLSVRQFFEKESSTYTYLLVDKISKDAIFIDPVLETVERYTDYCIVHAKLEILDLYAVSPIFTLLC